MKIKPRTVIQFSGPDHYDRTEFNANSADHEDFLILLEEIGADKTLFDASQVQTVTNINDRYDRVAVIWTYDN